MFESEDVDTFDFGDDIVVSSINPPEQSTFKRTNENVDTIEAESKIDWKKPKFNSTRKTPVGCSTQRNVLSRTDSFLNSGKNVVRRKFPGPAGLLPDLGASVTLDETLLLNPDESLNNSDEIICSQRSASVFTDSPWMEMTKDLKNFSREGLALIEEYNIKWIYNQRQQRKLCNEKVPFLVSLIDNIEPDGKNTSIRFTLKDMTGEIEAVMLHNLYEKYSDDLTVGSVLILKQFGVFSTGNTHCLVITPKNLITIYTQTDHKENYFSGNREGSSQRKEEEVTSKSICRSGAGNVKKVRVIEINFTDIIKSIQETKSRPGVIKATALSKHNSLVEEPKRPSLQNLQNNFNSRTSRNPVIVNNCIRHNSLEDSDIQLNHLVNSRNESVYPGRPEPSSCAEYNVANSCKERESGGSKRFKFVSKPNVLFNTDLDDFNISFERDDDFGQLSSDKSVGQVPFKSNILQNDSSASKVSSTITKESTNDNKQEQMIDDGSVTVSNSQILIKSSNPEHTQIAKSILDDIDADSLFEDF